MFFVFLDNILFHFFLFFLKCEVIFHENSYNFAGD